MVLDLFLHAHFDLESGRRSVLFLYFFYNLVIYVSHALLFCFFFPKIFEMKASLHGYLFAKCRGVRRRPGANYANARDFRVDRFVKSC